MKQTIHIDVRRNILLNPGPATTTATVKAGLIVPDICPRESEFGDLLGMVKEKTLRVVNAGSNYEAILLGGSGTAAVESCLSSCTNEKAILILENGAYGDRMKKICDALKIKSHTIKSAWGDALNLDAVEAHLKTNAKDYSVIAFIHHETTVGILNDLSKINQLAKKYQLRTLVDAMSSYAGIEIDLAVDDLDYLVSSSNKCIQGMAGLGMCIVKKETLNEIKNYPKRSFYLDLTQNFLAQEKTNQFAFTPPVQILYSLNVAFDEFFIEGGVKARAKRYSDLYELMLKGMTELGFETLVDKNLHSKILTAFKEPKIVNFSFEKMHDYLYQKGITIYPGKSAKENSFRISNIGELNTDDILEFLQGVAGYLKTIR
jgi:2-aminoethylphosphonate-pyruvate transaminase